MAQWVKHKLEFNLHMLNTPEYWEYVKLEDATAILKVLVMWWVWENNCQIEHANDEINYK